MIITDLQYFGTIDFIKSLTNEQVVYFDNDCQFSKMTFKNRMVIATAQGALHLSIPVIGGRDQKLPLKEVKIANDSPWNQQHYKALTSSYQRAPYFEYYQEELKSMYNSKPVFLLDFLLQTHNWLKKQIKGNWEIMGDDVYAKNNINNALVNVKFSQVSLPKNYNNQPDTILYQQVFEDRVGFLPNLCILDMLFCCGGKQVNYLLSNK